MLVVSIFGVWRHAAAEAPLEPAACSILQVPLDGAATVDEIARAKDSVEDCLGVARAGGHRSLEARALVVLAELQGLEGLWEESLAAAESAVARAQRAGDRATEARSHQAVGDALFQLSLYEEALLAFERELAGYVELGDRQAEAYALKNLGITHALLGRRDLALIRLEEAMERVPEWRDEALAVSILGNLGTIYYRLGAPRAAQRAYLHALDLARARGRQDEVSDVLGRLAYHQLWVGRPVEARELFVEALAAARRTTRLDVELWLLEGAASAFAATGDESAAQQLLERLLASHRPRNDVVSTCAALLSLGGFLEDRRPHEAMAAYRQAETLAERAGPTCRWQSLAGRGRMESRQGRRDDAIATYLQAIAAFELRWRGAVSDTERRSLLTGADATFRDLAALLVERGEDHRDPTDLDLAFVVVERSRGALLTRAIAEADWASPPDLPAEQRRAIRRLEDEIRALRRRREAPAQADAGGAQLEELLTRREAELDEHLRNVRRATAVGAPPHPRTVEETRRLLPPGVALVSYLVEEERTLAFLATAAGVKVEHLATRRTILADRVAAFLDLLQRPAHPGWIMVGSRLYRDLVEPWARLLDPGIETVIIVPDRELKSLPFEALVEDREGSRMLVDRFAVAYAPSATALAELSRKAPATGADVLVFADPHAPSSGEAATRRLHALYLEDGHDLAPIPFGRKEGRRVAAWAGASGHLLVGGEASEVRAKSLPLERFRIVHFATHGLLSPNDPRRSALLMSPDPDSREDGFLQAREIEQLRLAADLVVLSACRTARDPEMAGEAMQSLAEAFFHAGARSVVGTLWDVEDAASMRLMASFHRHLAAGRGKAEALRQAKLDAADRGAPPQAWAGFVLLGEPTGRVPLAGYSPARRAALGSVVVVGLALLVGGAWALRAWRARPHPLLSHKLSREHQARLMFRRFGRWELLL
ncbi:MAG: CHAT domain-containing protein [Thermoanaerobaculia bacterium]